MRLLRLIPAGALAALALAAPAVAETRTSNRVAAFEDWSVFVETEPRECFATTLSAEDPERQVLVTFWLDREVSGEVSFYAGPSVPFGNATLMARAGDHVAEIFPRGHWAWSPSAEADRNLLLAMATAMRVQLTGETARGAALIATFSTDGMVEALGKAARLCGRTAPTLS